MNFLRGIQEENVFFEMDSTVKIAETHYDIKYSVSAWELSRYEKSWDYEITLLEVGQCPASWLTQEVQKEISSAINDDIYTEIYERR